MIKINSVVANIFRQKADKIEISGKNVYRAIAFRKAAKAIEEHPEGLDTIYKRSWIKGIEKIPGVGNRIARAVENELNKLGIKR